jgi:hypothetical protein
MFMKSFTIVAMRGRNPDNPSERGRSNGRYKQRLEPNMGGVSNTITSVGKDNLVLEQVCTACQEAEASGNGRKTWNLSAKQTVQRRETARE